MRLKILCWIRPISIYPKHFVWRDSKIALKKQK